MKEGEESRCPGWPYLGQQLWPEGEKSTYQYLPPGCGQQAAEWRAGSWPWLGCVLEVRRLSPWCQLAAQIP